MRTLTLKIDESLSGQTVHRLLADRLCLSNSLIRRLKLRETGILLNGVRAFTTARVQAGDVLTAEIGDAGETGVRPMAMPLSIVYEDEDLLVIDKPAGIAVHPARDPEEITLENALAAYLRPGEIAHPVSRLDRGTTGLMTVAKNGYMHEALRRLLHTDAFFREYRGICVGAPSPESGTIELPIGFAEGSRYQRAVTPGGAPSKTGYETLARCGAVSLLRLVPYTGRTHQLRVHLAAIGHPLVGDWLYGSEEPDRIARPALHSYQLSLTHPLTGKRLLLTAPLPPDMEKLLAESPVGELG